MGRIRKCNGRCHNARRPRCRCWCGGYFHGKDGAGAVNRAALAEGMTELLQRNGFKEGETAYVEQKELPVEVVSG